MAIREVALSTVVWAKEMSTNVFIKLGRGLFSVSFVQRNTKKLGVGLLIWFLISLSGYFALKNAVKGLKNSLFEIGLSQTQSLGKKIGASLLENDILSLNRAIGDVEAGDEFIFAAVLDHENKIVAHTRSQFVDQILVPLDHIKKHGVVNGISIEEGISVNKQKTIAFSKDVTFSGVKIGKVYLALSGTRLYSSSRSYGKSFALGVFSALIAMLAIVTVLDRLFVAKAQKAEKKYRGLVKLGPYTLVEKLATGGMAELFVAKYERQDGFRKTVAVKRVLPQFADNPDFIKMFIREARLAALLNHPNVVQVTDFGEIKNTYFLGMEYIRGKNLAEILAATGKWLAIDQAVFIVTCIAMGLQYSHAKKDEKSGMPLELVHRDISPQNILISYLGEVKISDFGISKASTEISLTRAGVVKGKLSYLSPEQALGKSVDHQTDIYALGIVFYEILSGNKLYNVKSEIEALKIIPETEVQPIKALRSEVPDELNRIVMKCLEKDKASRYQEARELIDDLNVFRNSMSITYDSTMLSEFMKKHFK